MGTPVTNFADVLVSIGYDASATSVVVSTGGGSRFPSTFPYPVTWWNATDYPNPADDPNREIVLVTNRVSDTLTVVRAQEGTSATAKNTGGKTYRVSLGITQAMWEEVGLSGNSQQHRGLGLQTHRDADLAAYTVELVAVESIVMDDSTELRNDSNEWTGLTANIANSGAGGLDTGTEENSRWYEIYAIAKEDDTRNLLLHRHHRWAYGATYTSGEDATQGIRSAVDNSTVSVAQGFQIADSGELISVDVKLLKVGSPTGYIWFDIQADSGGVPDGTPIAVSALYDVSRFSTTALTIRFPFFGNAQLSASTQYHLVANGTWTVSAANYVGWRMDGSAGAYASGSKSLYDSDTATWTADADDDLIFSVTTERQKASVTLPTGYTKKCLLGYVWNNSSGNFERFYQSGRTYDYTVVTKSDQRLIDETASGVTLQSLNEFVPNFKSLRVKFGLSGTGAAAATLALGDLTATDLSSSAPGTAAQMILYAGLTSELPSVFGEMAVNYMGVMYEGTSGADVYVSGFTF